MNNIEKIVKHAIEMLIFLNKHNIFKGMFNHFFEFDA